MALGLFVVVFLVSTSLCQHLIVQTFNRGVLCDVATRISQGCSTEVAERILSMLHCVSLCVSNSSCIGASFDTQGVCFLHKVCNSLDQCVVEETNHYYMTKNCDTGSCDALSKSCQNTERKATDLRNEGPQNTCEDLIISGYDEGEYIVNLQMYADSGPFVVVCYICPPSTTHTYLARNEGRFSFNRTWEEYSSGFFIDDYNMWAGLEFWHQMTTYQYTEVVFRVHFRIPSSHTWETTYRLEIASEYNLYELHSVEKVQGNDPNDCFQWSRGEPFSTWDRDNNYDYFANEPSCVPLAGLGWWYERCDISCNFLGRLGLSNSSNPYWSYQRMWIDGLNMDQAGAQISHIDIYIYFDQLMFQG